MAKVKIFLRLSSLQTWFIRRLTDWGAPKLRCLNCGSSRIVTVHLRGIPPGEAKGAVANQPARAGGPEIIYSGSGQIWVATLECYNHSPCEYFPLASMAKSGGLQPEAAFLRIQRGKGRPQEAARQTWDPMWLTSAMVPSGFTSWRRKRSVRASILRVALMTNMAW